MASASEPAALLVKNASLKDAAKPGCDEAGIHLGDEGRTFGSGCGSFVWK